MLPLFLSNLLNLPPSPAAALVLPVTASINHLLAQEPWARRQLVPHAGKLACFDFGAFQIRMRVTCDALLERADSAEPANVTIRIKLSDLPLIAQNRERAFSYVKIEGDAEFANTISQLSKSLRWEAEHDLERWTGPVAAQRIVSGARSAFENARTSQHKLAENVAEFFLEEEPLLVRPLALAEFSADVGRVRDDVERMGKRIERLEQRLQPRLQPAGAAPTQSGGQQILDI